MAQPIMKRQYRNDMPQQQKDKISQKLQGRTLNQITKNKISQSMQKYWQNLPIKPTSDNPYTTNDNNNNSDLDL